MKFDQLAAEEVITQTVAGLKERGFEAVVVASKEEALAKVKELIPAGASVMNGSSVTLKEIGFIDYLKSDEHAWKNLHADVVTEQDKDKQVKLREEALHSEYYVGSVHALTESGEIVIASNSGSQLPHVVYTSKNLVLVVSTKKIVKDVSEAFKRIESYIVPLEDVRMKEAMGFGTMWSKTVILNRENKAMGRTVRIILVKEKLGY